MLKLRLSRTCTALHCRAMRLMLRRGSRPCNCMLGPNRVILQLVRYSLSSTATSGQHNTCKLTCCAQTPTLLVHQSDQTLQIIIIIWLLICAFICKSILTGQHLGVVHMLHTPLSHCLHACLCTCTLSTARHAPCCSCPSLSLCNIPLCLLIPLSVLRLEAARYH